MTPRWIPTTDRLPTAPGAYLVFAESADPEKPLCCTAHWSPEVGWLLVPIWARAISHWMPLPDPPRTGPLGRRASRN